MQSFQEAFLKIKPEYNTALSEMKNKWKPVPKHELDKKMKALMDDITLRMKEKGFELYEYESSTLSRPQVCHNSFLR